jgi:hypothetical protein
MQPPHTKVAKLYDQCDCNLFWQLGGFVLSRWYHTTALEVSTSWLIFWDEEAMNTRDLQHSTDPIRSITSRYQLVDCYVLSTNSNLAQLWYIVVWSVHSAARLVNFGTDVLIIYHFAMLWTRLKPPKISSFMQKDFAARLNEVDCWVWNGLPSLCSVSWRDEQMWSRKPPIPMWIAKKHAALRTDRQDYYPLYVVGRFIPRAIFQRRLHTSRGVASEYSISSGATIDGFDGTYDSIKISGDCRLQLSIESEQQRQRKATTSQKISSRMKVMCRGASDGTSCTYWRTIWRVEVGFFEPPGFDNDGSDPHHSLVCVDAVGESTKRRMCRRHGFCLLWSWW